MEKKKKLYCVANAHLDTQWNWTIQDTIRDCVKSTLERNFYLMDKYPHYRMNFEGAFRYKLAKEYYPDLYEKLKGYIAEGRWNVAGSTWDAMDANVPSSEALMRQILYGNGFFEKEFGKKSTDIFLTDCFGFRYALPSIEAHMGLNGFSTQKLVWGVGSPIYNEDGTVTRPEPEDRDTPREQRKPRMDLGKWIGPDGKGVAVSLLEGDYTYNFDRGFGPEHRTDDRPVGQRQEYLRAIEHNEKYTGIPSRSMYFGTGDYGGSCKEISAKMLNEAIDKNGENLYEVIAASTDDIFNDLTPEEFDALPTYDGELLIPHGSGAVTSHTINKRWNRKNELLADSAERAAVMAAWLGASEYPEERLLTAWQTFLWHQFHDDLPGTSIASAYVFTYNDYVIALNMFAAELNKAVGGAAKALDTNVTGTPVVVYNPVSTARNDIVTVSPIDIDKPYVRVFAPCGCEVPAQYDAAAKTLKFAAKTPAVSCAVFDVRHSDEPSPLAASVSVTERTVENERYLVTIDENGDIASIVDKVNGNQELLSAPAGLEIGPDTSQNWPSWELVWTDSLEEPIRVKDNVKIEIAENGPAVCSLKITRTHGGSSFEQTVRLTAGGQRVDVACKVDWFERASNLRAAFPLAVSNPKAAFDLGLGAIDSGNTDSFPYYQHVVHQWADLTAEDGSYGVSILNDCKYGMDKPNDNTLRLTLIHTPLAQFSPESGQDWQDMGLNLFTYSIMGHKGPRTGETTKEAAELNQPQMSFRTSRHGGAKKVLSLVSVSDDAAIIRAVKKEEKGDRIIVRVQNTVGHALKDVKLTFAANLTSVTETNGYEDEIAPVAFDGNTLTLDFGKYGVRTFAVELEAPACAVAPVEYVPLGVPVDKRITSYQFRLDMGEFAQGISIPGELWEEEIVSSGVPFLPLREEMKNAMTCRGQTIKIPEGATSVSILAASANGDKTVTFRAGGKEIPVSIQDFHDNVGAWDQLVNGKTPLIKRDEIAKTFTHTHDKDGDRLYLFAYLFRYEIPVSGAESLTFPDDEDILVVAATASFETDHVEPWCDLYDRVETSDAPVHTLTLVNCAGHETKYTYQAGKTALVRTSQYDDGWVFEGWEGEGIAAVYGPAAVIKMPDHDVTVKIKAEKLGHDILLNKPATAIHEFNEREKACNAVNGNDRTKWCAADESGKLWLAVDAGEVCKVNRWFVMHGGAVESPGYNTRDFSLQYKVNEGDEWQTADTVTDNHDNQTLRDFPAVEGRYFRLWIDRATQHRDPTARIYMFQVFEA